MFREARRPKGDPEVLAARSREQYFKVLIDRYVALLYPHHILLVMLKFYLGNYLSSLVEE